MQKNNTVKKQTKKPSKLYKRTKIAPKRTYKRKPKQSPTPIKKSVPMLNWFGFLLVPFIILIVMGGAK